MLHPHAPSKPGLQRAPECDMVLVHDDDLALVSRTFDDDVSEAYALVLSSRQCLVVSASTVTGNLSIRCGETLPRKIQRRDTPSFFR
jgi:hypothetical protein